MPAPVTSQERHGLIAQAAEHKGAEGRPNGVAT